MCGTSWASYATVTDWDSPGMVLLVIVAGFDMICTLAVMPPAVAVTLPAPVPSGGV
jgi:hypothetical protein